MRISRTLCIIIPTMRRFSTAVTITDPLVKYQTLVSSGLYAPDPAQHRLARHLHKVYLRIKDYSPQQQYRERLNQVAKVTEKTSAAAPEEDNGQILAWRSHSIWRNPLFKHLLSSPEGRESLALTRVLTSHETAIEINSPKGLFLSGEVGTGKSMLLDLLADGLPTERKRRWHFNTFMLYAFSQLEKHRKAKSGALVDESPDYSILWLSKKLVDESPILFLDEFQLPDRAASKILSHLFITFFQLGGVLIASSNRMPEELQKATGLEYTPAPSQGLVRRILGHKTGPRGELFGQTSDFANFLEVLKARCDFWQMEGATDWRRREEAEVVEETGQTDTAVHGADTTGSPDDVSGTDTFKRPVQYLLPTDSSSQWDAKVLSATGWTSQTPVPWQSSSLVVYGRPVLTPHAHNGVVYWDFDALVSSFGPADYITMASSYHTFIIDNIPVLTLTLKNEARRFITLLDALYEARCKLLIRAAAPPDDLFFPTKPNAKFGGAAGDDATYSETIAEVFQDQMSPFRPNISYYDTNTSTAKYNPDQDSDFGMEIKKPIDFGNTSAFTGEDERFAYKRGVSRLWELCSAQWHAREGDWWKPLPMEARHWEGGVASKAVEWKFKGREALEAGGEGMGESMEVEEPAGLSKWRIEWLKGRG